MKDHYRIMGNYHGNTEEVDHADVQVEAERLRDEYQLAFGPSWSVWVEVQTFDSTGTLDDCHPLADYEQCARCGFDHEYEHHQAQQAHKDCPLCAKEVSEGMVGEGPDHSCEQENYES